MLYLLDYKDHYQTVLDLESILITFLDLKYDDNDHLCNLPSLNLNLADNTLNKRQMAQMKQQTNTVPTMTYIKSVKFIVIDCV